jgi:anti-sigma factor RsiW
MIVAPDHPPDLSTDDEADLVAFVDDRLDPGQRARVEARAAKDPAFAAALARQRRGRDAVTAAVETTGAPLALRTRVEQMGTGRGRRKADQRPSARTRLAGRRWPAAGLVAGALAAVLAGIVLIGGGPGIYDVAAAALNPPAAAIAPVPAGSKLLHEHVGEVAFPNYAGKFGWKAAGTRTDEIDGRATRTVFYEKEGRQIAYTVVSGAPLGWPDDATKATREGTLLRALRADGREVVTWRRRGHTCVLSAKDVPRAELLDLAGWKGKGAVGF